MIWFVVLALTWPYRLHRWLNEPIEGPGWPW